MKNNLIRIGAVVLIVAALLIMGFLRKPTKEIKKMNGKGFAVVELFTSEGCSSCPAADAEVEKVSGLYPDNVYVLGFHVDYWNRLGWKDEFSAAAYSDRQRKYATQFKLDGVYTPQVVVNGRQQLVGSDARALESSIGNEIRDRQNTPVEIIASASPDQHIRVAYKTAAPAGTVINIALIQSATKVDVKAGENGGRTLGHINIVRDFKSVDQPAGTADLALPKGLTAGECKVLAYLQEKATGNITGANTIAIK